MDFINEPKNWVALGLFGVIAIAVWQGVHRSVFKALDDRAAGIARELAEAKRLREEAEALLKQYALKEAAAQAEASAIVAQAKADAEALLRAAERQLAQDLSRRERQTEERIQRAEEAAAADMRAKAVDAAIAAAEKMLRERIKGPTQSAIVQNGARGLGQALS